MMYSLPLVFGRFKRQQQGNIAISAALSMPIIVMILGLGVDYGALTLQKRTAQNTADLSAIVAAARLTDAESNLAQHFRSNGINLLVATSRGLMTPEGAILGKTEPSSAYDGIATVERGRYIADPAIAVDERFVKDAVPYDAARVRIDERGQMYFAGIFGTTTEVGAAGVAAVQKYASFTIGSRLASVNNGLLNGVLGGLLGTKVSLNVMDYQALVDLDINALSFVDALAINLDLQALSYDDILAHQITYGAFLDALGKTTGVTPTASAILKKLQTSVAKANAKLTLDRILDLSAIGSSPAGTHENLDIKANLFELVNAAAVAAGGGRQLGIDLAGTIPGLSSVKLTVAVGEPAVGTPMARVGDPGTIVRTAQTRVLLDASVNGLSLLAGLKLRLPIYAEVAYAEAKLADIRCLGGPTTNANVTIDAVPGVAELALGSVDTSALQNFSSTPRVTPVSILSTIALRINGMAHVTITNTGITRMTFTPNDIAAQKLKNVSTRDPLTSAVSTLLGNLSAEINIVGIPLGTPKAIQQALADTLANVTRPLDDLLYNTLLVLGVKIGEADITVSDVRCKNAVLVQ